MGRESDPPGVSGRSLPCREAVTPVSQQKLSNSTPFDKQTFYEQKYTCSRPLHNYTAFGLFEYANAHIPNHWITYQWHQV